MEGEMIFWYEDLYMDDSVRKHEERCRKTIEKRSVWQKLPWKKSYYIITLAKNSKNLFEIMGTDEMFFRYYGYTDIYIVGVAREYDSAVEILIKILTKGYQKSSDYDPRDEFTKECFHAGKE